MALLRILPDRTIEKVLGGGTQNGWRYVGSTAPSTAQWSANDVWLDTSTATTSVGPTLRVWTGSSFLPTPGGGSTDVTVVLSDDFTGTDGAAWNASKWGMGRNQQSGTGAGVTLLSGTGLMQTSSSAPDSGAATVARRALITSIADTNITCAFKFDSTRAYLDVNIRHDTDFVDGNNCYSLRLRSAAAGTGGQTMAKQVAYSTTALASKNQTFTNGTWYKLRFQAIGTTIRARIWEQSATEPGTWDMSVTDSTFTGAGKVGLCGRNGTANARVFVDDLIIRNAA